MDINEEVHKIEQDLIKIKTNQNSSNDSAMLYRLDVDLRPYLSSSGKIIRVLTGPVSNYDKETAIIMPIGQANSPPTLVPQPLDIGQHPGNPFEFYFWLFGTHSSYPKFDTYGARMSVYSNIKLYLISITEI